MIIKEILDMKQFKNMKVIAGKNGLERKVSAVSVMDYLDIYNWMKGGEFLITSGAPMKNNPEFMMTLIEKLNQKNVACFGIKTDRFLGTIPQNAIDLANELNFPLIFIPNEYAFTDIINPVLNKIIFEQGNQLKVSNEIHTSFTNLAIQECGVDKVIEILGEIISQEVAFYSYQFLEMHIPSDSQLNEQLQNYRFPDDIDSVKKNFETFEVKNKSSTYGIIILGKIKFKIDFEKTIALKHASTVLILESQKRISKYHQDEKFKLEIIHDIIYKNIQSEAELINRAQICGWNFTHGGIAVIVDVDNFKVNYNNKLNKVQTSNLDQKVDLIYKLSVKKISNQFSTVASTKLNDYIVFIISDKDKNVIIKLQKIFARLQENIYNETGFTCTVGIGNFQTSCMNLGESYLQAKQCITIYKSIGKKNSMVIYNDLGLYKIANLIINTPEATELLDKFIHKIIEYDKKYKTEFFKTFVSICSNNWNLKATSKELFIHYNTIKYRYDRICILTNCNYDNINDKIQAVLALKIYEMTPSNLY